MAGGIPSGLGALLSRLGLGAPAATPGGVDVKGLKTGQPAAEKPGADKGQVLGPDGTHLTGLGFNHADKQSIAKNLTEEGNVARFLEAVQEGDKPLLFKDKQGEVGQSRKAETENKEAKDARDERGLDNQPQQANKRDEQIDDKRSAAQLEANEQQQAKDKRETPDAEAARQRQDDEQKEDRGHGQGWVMEEIEGEEATGKEKLRDVDPLGHHHRCHGTLDDGVSRCLRKPAEGTAYCPEHAAQWQIRSRRIEPA